jgi:hypothetical protein
LVERPGIRVNDGRRESGFERRCQTGVTLGTQPRKDLSPGGQVAAPGIFEMFHQIRVQV